MTRTPRRSPSGSRGCRPCAAAASVRAGRARSTGARPTSECRPGPTAPFVPSIPGATDGRDRHSPVIRCAGPPADQRTPATLKLDAPACQSAGRSTPVYSLHEVATPSSAPASTGRRHAVARSAPTRNGKTSPSTWAACAWKVAHCACPVTPKGVSTSRNLRETWRRRNHRPRILPRAPGWWRIHTAACLGSPWASASRATRRRGSGSTRASC